MKENKILIIGESEATVSSLREGTGCPTFFLEESQVSPEKVFQIGPSLMIIVKNGPMESISEIITRNQDVQELKDVPTMLVIPKTELQEISRLETILFDDLITTPFDLSELKIRVDSLLKKNLLSLQINGLKKELNRANEQMKEKMFLMTTLFVVGEKLKEHLDPTEIYRAIRETLSGISDVKCFSIYLFDEGRNNLVKVTSKDIAKQIPEKLPVEESDGPIKEVLDSEEAYCHSRNDSTKQLKCGDGETHDFFGVPLLAVLPIKTGKKNLGIINIHELKETQCDKIDFNLLTILTAQVASAIYNCELHKKIENVAAELDLTSKKLEKSKLSLEEQMFHLNTITLFSSQLHSTFKLEEVYEVIRDLLVNFLGIEIFHIIYFDEGNQDVYIGMADGVPREDEDKLPVSRFKSVTDKVMRTGESFFRPDSEDDAMPSLLKVDESSPLACLPLMLDEKPRGVLVIESLLPQKDGFNKEDYELLSLLTQEAALSLMTGRLYPKVQSKSITDPNTGLFNHSHFQKCIDLEFLRARRYKTPLSLLLIDVDDFNKLNAAHGYLIGDAVLSDIAKILDLTRSHLDVLAQYGQEEFGVLLPQTSPEGAVILAERIREAIEEYSFQGKDGPTKVTVSIGVAGFPFHKSKEAIISAAESSLMDAKKSGKNQVKSNESNETAL